MGRINEAMRRLAGAPDAPRDAPAASDAKSLSTLEQYSKERSPAPDDDAEFMRRELRGVPNHAPSARREPVQTTPSLGKPALVGVPPPPAAATAEMEPEKLIDVAQIADYVGFVGRALLRHKALSAAAFLVTIGLTATAALMWPETWEVESKLLVQRNDTMAHLVNPGRTIRPEAETPTNAAEEIVLRRDNLISVIQQTNLMAEWERTRVPLLRAKDRVFRLLWGEPTDEERLDAMVGTLEKNMRVSTGQSGNVVNFDVSWRDPRMAYEIADKAIQNFLQDRKQGQTSAIADSIAILERSQKALEAQVEKTIAELPKRPGPRVVRSSPLPAAVALTPEAAGPPPELTAKLARAKAALDGRQQDFMRLEGQRRAELAQLQARLAAATTIYTEGHPTIVGLRQSVAVLARESPEEQSVRRAVEVLEQEYDALNATVLAQTQHSEDAKRAAALASVTRAGSSVELPPTDYSGLFGEANDPTSLRLKVELSQLAALRERVSAARAELSSSQAGFKYQYNIIRPPQIPRRPVGPNVPAIIAAGILGSILLAILVAVSADLTSGRIVEPWQVERQVGVPVAVRMSAL